MVNVGDKDCEHIGCYEKAYYNYRGGTKKYCIKHKEPGMVLTKDNLCKVEECPNKGIYNHKFEVKGSFCKHHKESEMVEIKK